MEEGSISTFEGAYARKGQLLSEHSQNTAALASLFGSKFGAGTLMRVAGFLHDLGKMTPEFQQYLFDENGIRGSVRHSVAGAKQAYMDALSYPPVAETFGNIISSHHGALCDSLSPDGHTPLKDKLEDAPDLCPPGDGPSMDMDALKAEYTAILSLMPPNEKAFGLSMLMKMMYSCLVDADRLDAYLSESGGEPSFEKPDWGHMTANLERELAKVNLNPDTPIARLRQEVSSACSEAGSRDKGIYKLEVPTGGGKTLSSLRFALEHARRHNMDRIIYVIPYLSILSQTAKEIREKLNADDKTVLEHHSGFLPDNPEYYKLQTDRWDAPIILTTLVQWLENLFSARGSDLRKLHNMSRSVLIFDEAQSLPVKCVHLFNGAINFLCHVCGSTALLCTATQPLLDAVPRPILFSQNPSIVRCGPLPERTRIQNRLVPGGYSYSDLAALVIQKHSLSTLVIVNTKSAAKALCGELLRAEMPALHLSTNMCSAHRENTIAELRRRLAAKESAVCVSTALIEAGVDISFECVIRDIAGLDSILQAAGRCNRHGEDNEAKDVYVVNIAGENLNKLPDVKIGAEITRRLYDDQTEEMNEYYRYFFHERRGMMDYPTEGGHTAYDLLSTNRSGQSAYKDQKEKRGTAPPSLRCAIRSAADAFYVIDKGRTDVIVPYGESEKLIALWLKTENLFEKRGLLSKLGRYSVSLYGYQMDALARRGALKDCGGLSVLAGGFYNKERGVELEGIHEFLCI